MLFSFGITQKDTCSFLKKLIKKPTQVSIESNYLAQPSPALSPWTDTRPSSTPTLSQTTPIVDQQWPVSKTITSHTNKSTTPNSSLSSRTATSSSTSSPASLRKRPHSNESINRWINQRPTSSIASSIQSRQSSTIRSKAAQKQYQHYQSNSIQSTSMSSIGRSRSRSSSVANNTARALALLPEPLPAQQHQQLLCLQDTLQTIPAMPNKSAKYDPVEWPDVLSRGNDEQDRMVAQHYILRTAFGGDFSAPARSMLEKGCVVLDVGCGPGTWTMEMSTEFPNSSFIGIDCLNAFPRDIKPKNCHFRTCTVGQQSSTTLASLPFPDNSIDYIFQRDLNLGLQAHMWSPLVKEYLRILKPGGWVELMEPDMETQSSLRNECAMNDKLLYGLSLRQQDPYVGRRLPSILAVNGFRRVESEFQSLPLGWGSSHASPLSSPTQPTHPNASESNPRNPSLPVDLSPPCSEFARAVSSHYLFTLQSLQPWLSAVINISPEKYAATISNLPAEWKQARTYINWHCAVAQKPRTEEPF